MFRSFFRESGNTRSKSLNYSKGAKPRRFQLESLEDRTLLAVTLAEFDAIRAAYPELELSANMSNYNVIEIQANQVSATSLQAAIAQATSSNKADLIVIRTNAVQSFTVNNLTLTVDINPATSGSLDIVTVGSGRLEIQGSAQSGVISVVRGDIGLGGLVLNGVAGSNGQTVSVYDILQVSPQATVTVSNLVKYTEIDSRPGNFTISDNIASAASLPAPLAGPVNPTKSYNATFTMGGTLEGFLTGLSEAEMQLILGGNRNFAQLDPYDAEKTGVADTEHCWAGTSANMIAYAGWGNINGFQNEDDIFEYFTANFNDMPGNSYYANIWFLNGDYAPRGWAGWAQPQNTTSGNLYNCSTAAYTGYVEIDSAYSLTSGIDKLRTGYAAGLSIGWYNLLTGNRDGGHAITLWGSVYNTAVDPNSPSYYVSLFITDSDDNYGGGRTAPNVLQNHTILFDSRDGRSGYYFDKYGQIGATVGVIEAYSYLAPKPANPLPKAADLFPYTPTGWSAPLVITPSVITNTDIINVSYAFANLGDVNIASTACTYSLTITGGNLLSPITQTFNAVALNYGVYLSGNTTFSPLSGGKYTLTITLDTKNEVVELSKVNNVFSVNFTVEGFIQDLPAPNLLQVTATGAASIDVKWNTVNNAVGYTIQYALDPNFTQSVRTVRIDSPAATAYSLTKLLADTTYYVRIMAHGDQVNYNDSVYSPAKSAKTDPLPPQLGTPTEFTAVGSAIDQVTVSWKPSDLAETYRLECSADSRFQAGNTNVITVRADQVQIDPNGRIVVQVDKLNANTSYFFRVRAETSNIQLASSNWTATAIATTYIGYSIPPKGTVNPGVAPGELVVTLPTANNPKGYGYILLCSETPFPLDGSMPDGVATIESVSPKIDLDGLKAATTYFFKYRLNAPGGVLLNPWSESFSAKTTDTLDAPSWVVQAVRGEDTIDIAWTATPGATHYIIEWRPGEEMEWDILEEEWGKTEYLLTGLESGSTHQFRITAASSVEGVISADPLVSNILRTKVNVDIVIDRSYVASNVAVGSTVGTFTGNYLEDYFIVDGDDLPFEIIDELDGEGHTIWKLLTTELLPAGRTEYTITISAKTTQGDDIEQEIVITSYLPQVTANTAEVYTGAGRTFDLAAIRLDSVATAVSYNWTYTDKSGAVVNKTGQKLFFNGGDFTPDVVGGRVATITLVAIDQWGIESLPYTVTVNLEDRLEIVATPSQINTPSGNSVYMLSLDVDYGAILSWEIQWGDNFTSRASAVSTTMSFIHYYRYAGDYSITVVLTTISGLTVKLPLSVTITPPAPAALPAVLPSDEYEAVAGTSLADDSVVMSASLPTLNTPLSTLNSQPSPLNSPLATLPTDRFSVDPRWVNESRFIDIFGADAAELRIDRLAVGGLLQNVDRLESSWNDSAGQCEESTASIALEYNKISNKFYQDDIIDSLFEDAIDLSLLLEESLDG